MSIVPVCPLQPSNNNFLSQKYLQDPTELFNSIRDTETSTYQPTAPIYIKEILKKQYGQQTVEKIFERYQLNNQDVLSLNDIRALFIGCSAHSNPLDSHSKYPTSNDVPVYEWQTSISSFYPAYKELLDKDLRFEQMFYDAGNFKCTGVTHPGHDTILSRIRKSVVPIFLILLNIALVALGIAAIILSFPVSLALAVTAIVIGAIGLGILKAIGIYYLKHKTIDLPISTTPMKDEKVPHAEFLAHRLAYVDLEEGQIIQLPAVEGKVSTVKVGKVINEGGYVCSVLVPYSMTHQEELTHLEDFKVHVVYRGTHDIKSAQRLPEAHSPGHSSFNLYRQRTLDAIRECTPLRAKKVSLEVSGHSLGSADAARFGDLIAVAQNRFSPENKEMDQKHFDTSDAPELSIGEPNWSCPKTKAMINKVKSVAMYLFNHTGIAYSTNESLLDNILKYNKEYINVTLVEEDRKDDLEKDWYLLDDTPKPTPLTQRCVYKIGHYKTDGDFVQQTGETTAGANLTFHTPTIQREVYVFDEGYGGILNFISYFGLNLLHAHQVFHFNVESNKGLDPRYAYANSENNLAAVEAHAADHVGLASSSSWQAFKRFISKPLGSAIPSV